MQKEEIILKRKEAGLSQRQVAFKARINRYRLSDYECGYLDLKEEELAKIFLVIDTHLKTATKTGGQK